MATKWTLVAVVAMAIGCGGHKSQPAAPSGGDEGGGEASASSGDDGMIPPETFDRINEALDGKKLVVSRCLSDAVTAGQADKGARGKVTLEFVVAPGGKAKDVKVQQSTVKNKAVEDCVVAKVEEIGFPDVPKDVEYSYTYGFESN
jgi:hypothetical protein